MYQYYVLEIQKHENGEFGHIVHWAYDASADRARMKAEAKYHEVLAAAAVSELPGHAASLIASDGACLMHQCYRHDGAAEEPESEPEAGQSADDEGAAGAVD